MDNLEGVGGKDRNKRLVELAAAPLTILEGASLVGQAAPARLRPPLRR
jgi:hypothetical protein